MSHFKKLVFYPLGFLAAALLLAGGNFLFAQAQPPAAKPAATTAKAAEEIPAAAPRAVPRIVATVNGQEISYQQLSKACIKDYGQEVLERIVSRFILESACQKAKVEITDDDIRQEVESISGRFGLSADQYLELIERERGISPVLYIRDIIWQQVAIRKLAGQQTAPTKEELLIEFARRYGPAVKARLIAVKTEAEALALRKEALKDISKFPELAREHSIDPYSASLGGEIPLIRRHLNSPEFEAMVFEMKPGQISAPFPMADQFLLILCEEQLPQDPAIKPAAVLPELEEIVRQSKMRDSGTKLAQKLMADAQMEIYLNTPKGETRPGVAATVGKDTITTDVLGRECVARYGRETLEGLINRALIEQAIMKAKIQITAEDMNKELARIALESLPPKPDGSPNVDDFVELLRIRHGATLERYREDVLWPALALAKLVEGTITVTQEELQRGYTANFGKKIRCRAIIMDNQREAQRVWGQARDKKTEENFIELAKTYSRDANSRALGGEIPPISKFGGQPELEKEAFNLAPGEMSGVIQIGDQFIILLCIGHTEPIGVTFEDVKDMIKKDIAEKKTQMAIAEKFQEILNKATIDNALTGTAKSPAAE